ncbi:hypothetical protein SFC11_07150 [Exiguobacterium indicum]|uniref:hypothetical protein n=1 Tax=Exiguobacterium indicum TaxID=296995 RepID=UPI003982516A
MKKFLMLSNEEIKRSFKLYVTILMTLVIFEIASVVYQILHFQSKIEDLMRKERLTEMQAVEQLNGPLTFGDATNYFKYMITLGIMFTILYAFQIWYRDWYGESKYIYRLLMLPGKRITILFSKLTTVLIFVCGFLGIQWVIILLSHPLYEWLLPDHLQVASKITGESATINMLYTFNVIDTFVILALALFIITMIFLFVLTERSYRKGKALLTIAGDAALLIVPFIVLRYLFDATSILVPNQQVFVYLSFILIYFAYVSWKCIQLLNHKVSI